MGIRLFRKSPIPLSTPIDLSADEYHHLSRVLRVKKNDPLTIIIENQTIHECELIQIKSNQLHVTVKKESKIPKRKTPIITLFQGIPKGDKFSDTLRMCTEIGVDHFVPIYTERSIPVQDPKKNKKRFERWTSICLSATLQSQRFSQPSLSMPISFEAFINNITHHNSYSSMTLKIVPWEEETSLSLKSFLHAQPSKQKNLPHIGLFIGPEGGLTKREIECLKDLNFNAISLGNTILRTEHAGYFTISQLLFAFEKS